MKQTDFDGQFSYSKIKSAAIDKIDRSVVSVFPNPAQNIIEIHGDQFELENIQVFNSIGQDVSDLSRFLVYQLKRIKIDLSELSSGVYFIKTKTTTNKIYKL